MCLIGAIVSSSIDSLIVFCRDSRFVLEAEDPESAFSLCAVLSIVLPMNSMIVLLGKAVEPIRAIALLSQPRYTRRKTLVRRGL
jgi:hypothetical protein